MAKQQEPGQAVWMDAQGNEVPEGSPWAARRLVDAEGNYDVEVARFYGLPEDPSERKIRTMQKEAMEPEAAPDADDQGDAGDAMPTGPRSLKTSGSRREG